MRSIQVGDVVSRTSDLALKARRPDVRIEVGDVVEKEGERCRVKWRDMMVEDFYGRGDVLAPGQRTWVNQKALAKVEG